MVLFTYLRVFHNCFKWRSFTGFWATASLLISLGLFWLLLLVSKLLSSGWFRYFLRFSIPPVIFTNFRLPFERHKTQLVPPSPLYAIIYHCYFYPFECFSYHHQLIVFHWSLSDSMSPQAFRTLLSILADLNCTVVWMVSTRVLISNSSSPFTYSLVTVPSAPNTIGITVNDDNNISNFNYYFYYYHYYYEAVLYIYIRAGLLA